MLGHPSEPNAVMTWSEWPSPAKLNLFLRIVGRRQDGYHDLQTVFRLLDFGDTLRLRVRGDGEILRHGDVPGVPVEHDLGMRAARLLKTQSGTDRGCDLAVQKRTPIGGGLGGGSSNAASVLVALNQLWATHWSVDTLAKLGLQLGADVPLFVRGHSAWAEGVGERLSPLSFPPSAYVVLDPHEHVSTEALFQAPELTRNAAPATMRDFLCGRATENAFEVVVRRRYPRVAAALDWLEGFGKARLSGSGACVFVETQTRLQAAEIAACCPTQFTAFVANGMDVSPLLTAVERNQV